MRAHLVQLDIAWEDKAANQAKVDALLADTDVREGDLVVLPEMFDTGFSLNIEATSDHDGVSADYLRDLAVRTRAFVTGGITHTDDGADKALNRSLTFAPRGELACRFDKVHPFSFGREGERFVGGNSVTLWDWPDDDGEAALRVCPAVCYDLRFPEQFRAGLSLGASAFTVIANWPEPRADHWRALLIARAIENQAVVIGVNRVGSDPHLAYAGGSIVIDERGGVIAEAGADECVLSAEINPSKVAAWREIFPAWRDMRPI